MAVIFCDIDGTVVEHSYADKEPFYQDSKALPGCIEKINEWYDKGHIIIFLTARDEKYRGVTEKMLKRNGFKYHMLITGLGHQKRILIGDKRNSLPNPVESITLETNQGVADIKIKE